MGLDEKEGNEILLGEAKKMIGGLKLKFPEIVGASISGSISMGLADKYSDIDIDIWLDSETFSKWIKEESCPLLEYLKEYNVYRELPTNLSFIKGDYKFDLALLSIEEIKKDKWKIEQKANRKNSIIVYDKEDIIKELIKEKTRNEEIVFREKEKYSNESPCSNEYYNFFISAYLNYNAPIAIARKKYEQAHLNLNRTIQLICEYLWARSQGHYPYPKSFWAITNKVLDQESKKLLSEAILAKENSEEDINRRRKLLQEFCKLNDIPTIKFYHHLVDLS